MAQSECITNTRIHVCSFALIAIFAVGLVAAILNAQLYDYTERTCYILKHSEIHTPTFVQYTFEIAVTTHLVTKKIKAISELDQKYYNDIIAATNTSCYFKHSKRDASSLVLKAPPSPESPKLAVVYVLVAIVVLWLLIEIGFYLYFYCKTRMYLPVPEKRLSEMRRICSSCAICQGGFAPNQLDPKKFMYRTDCLHLVHARCLQESDGSCKLCSYTPNPPGGYQMAV